jgi:YVTN family beta-propeller protein
LLLWFSSLGGGPLRDFQAERLRSLNEGRKLPLARRIAETADLVERQALDRMTIERDCFLRRKSDPHGVAVTPDGKTLYVADHVAGPAGNGTIWAIDVATRTAIPTIQDAASGFAMKSDGTTVYATDGNTVDAISTATNTLVKAIPVGVNPLGISVTPDGTKVYAVNFDQIGNGPQPGSVSVIDASTNTVKTTIPVGTQPTAFGQFIQPASRFAGTPGKANCYGQSVTALDQRYGALGAAATALGYSSVQVLRNAIVTFCGGIGSP